MLLSNQREMKAAYRPSPVRVTPESPNLPDSHLRIFRPDPFRLR